VKRRSQIPVRKATRCNTPDRKDGAPRQSPKNARRDTTPRTTLEKRPDPEVLSIYALKSLDNATIYELQQLVADAPPEIAYVEIHHRVPSRDEPRDTTARKIVINKSTGETRHYIQRRGKPTWYLQDSNAEPPSK
jgi:hypothetical protein